LKIDISSDKIADPILQPLKEYHTFRYRTVYDTKITMQNNTDFNQAKLDKVTKIELLK